jgi:hypothetical protein
MNHKNDGYIHGGEIGPDLWARFSFFPFLFSPPPKKNSFFGTWPQQQQRTRGKTR